MACMAQALSNQKLAEMRLRFGVDRVGLQTGDGSLNIGEARHMHICLTALPRQASTLSTFDCRPCCFVIMQTRRSS